MGDRTGGDCSEGPGGAAGAGAAVELRSRTLMCRNTKFDVFFDHVRSASGAEIENYLSIVPHGCPDDLVSGIGVLPDVGGRLGLIRVHRHPQGRASWEIVRGFIDQGETHAQAALRELAEETGVVAQAGELHDLGVAAPDAGVIRARIHLFAVRTNRLPERARAAELGHGELVFRDPDEVMRMMEQGEVEDACSLVALLRYCAVARSRAGAR